MRTIPYRLLKKIGGKEPLGLVYHAIQAIWDTTGREYRDLGLRDGYGLTATRNDRFHGALADVCGRYPGWFPAFDYDRRRSRAIALVERTGFVLTGGIVQCPGDWVEAATLRFDVGRQGNLFSQPLEEDGDDTMVAFLMVVNGRPRSRMIRDRPRAVVVKALAGDRQYYGDHLDLDKMFAPRIFTSVPRRVVVPKPVVLIPQRTVILPLREKLYSAADGGVKKEKIAKKRNAKLKQVLPNKASAPDGESTSP